MPCMETVAAPIELGRHAAISSKCRKDHAKPLHARTLPPRRGRNRRACGPARLAADTVLSRRRTDHRRPDLARRRRALARRLRHRRSRSGRAVRGDAALVRDRVLERDHRPADHALCARSGGGGHAGGRPRARRRADHRVDRDPAVHPQRAARARRPPARADAGGARRARRRRALPCLRAERYQRGRPRRRRGRALRRADGILARAGGADLPPARRQHRLQGRQCRRFLRALGQGPRLRGDARRRQRDDRRPRAQAGAHHADRSAARHPAEPGHRHAVGERALPASSSSACGSACAPTPSAAPGGRAIAGRIGATTPSCASRRSWRIASCRC